jgi:glycosyltransferase involved in cell wall biosynthesis
MATGCPVIVNRVGGAAESAVDGVAGAHYDPDDASGYRAAIDLATGIRPEAARARALDFDTARFVDDVRDWVLGEPAQAGASSRPNKVSSALG